MTFTENARQDKELQHAVYQTVKKYRAEGLPKTYDGLQNMFTLYNQVYGKNKKLTNCVYCRKAVAEYLEKAVTLLEMKAKAPKAKPKTKKYEPKKKAPAKKKPATRKK